MAFERMIERGLADSDAGRTISSEEMERRLGRYSDHLQVRRKIEIGLEDMDAGRTISEKEFDQRMAKWLKPNSP